MTKKSKQDPMSTLNRHHSQKIQHYHQSTVNSLTLKKSSQLKKSIRKPQQELGLLERVEQLKEKSHKFYKHAQKKIDRIIEMIDEIDEKHLAVWNDGSKNGFHLKNDHFEDEEVKHQAIQLQEDKKFQLIEKTLTHLHNLLTYERPLTHIKQEFQSFYSKLSQFAKQLSPESSLPNDKKFMIPENGLTFDELRNIEELIKEHYLRIGSFEVADLFDRYGKQMVENQDQENKEDNSQPDYQKYYYEKVNSKTNKTKNHILKFQNIAKHENEKPNLSQKPKRKPKVQLVNIQQNFKQSFNIHNKILNKNFESAIEWCVQERLYETHSNPLQFYLRLAEIKLLMEDKKYRVVFDKIEKQLVKFLDNFQQDINGLIGFLLFSCQWDADKVLGEESQQKNIQKNQLLPQQQQAFQTIITTRYQKYLPQTVNLPALAHSFTQQYFIHYNISQFDTLEICYKVGKLYQHQYFDSINLFSEKDRQQFLKHRGHGDLDNKLNGTPHAVVLPFEIPVEKQYMYHSIFVCPVTKEVLSSNDSVEWLSCGHLVSESAKKNMAEVRRSNHKQKCPVCQKDRASEIVKVRF